MLPQLRHGSGWPLNLIIYIRDLLLRRTDYYERWGPDLFFLRASQTPSIWERVGCAEWMAAPSGAVAAAPDTGLV